VSHSVYSVLLFTVPQWHVIAVLIKWPLKVITWENPWRHQPLLWYKQTGHQWTHGSDAAFRQITVTTCYSALIGEQSIVMSMSVCLSVCVCLSAIIASELHILSSPSFCTTCMLPMAVAQFSFDGTVIRYIFPVLLMMPYLHISWGCLKSPSCWGSKAQMQLRAWHTGSRHSGLLLAVRAY